MRKEGKGPVKLWLALAALAVAVVAVVIPLKRQDVASAENAAVAEGEPQAEKREAEEAKLVDAFDGLTDKWMKPSAKGVTMSDIDEFTKTFRKIPKARKDECVHRALNLIPDENVMLLAGI